jgi:hypothetical protein
MVTTYVPFAELTVRTGLAKPVGSFGNIDINDSLAGLAYNGFYLEPGLLFYITRNFSAGFLYHYQQNPFAASVVADYFRSQIPGVSFDCKATPWKVQGVFYSFNFDGPLNKAKDIWIKTGVALSYAKYTCPELVISGTSSFGRATITQHAVTARALALLTQLSLSYFPIPEVSFSLNMSLLAGRPSFDGVAVSSTGQPTYYDNFAQRMTTFNIGAGLNFYFNKISSK